MQRAALARSILLLLVPGLSLSLSSCAEGRLIMELELPADKLLDPTLQCAGTSADKCDQADPRLARLGLRISRGEEDVRTQESAITSSAELTVGEVPVGERLDLRLAAQSVTGQILGLGVVRDLVLAGDTETRVQVKFRKPITYVAGGDALRVLDTAATANPELPAVNLPGVVDVTAADNGELIVAITATQLLRIRTSDHFAAGCDKPLPGCAKAVELASEHQQPARCVAVSPDSSMALVCHDTGLTAVTGLSSGQPSTKFFQLGRTGRPTAVIFEPDGRHGWALVNGVERGCDGATDSVLVRLDLQTNQPTGEPIAIGQPAAALALDPIDNRPLVALPCGPASSDGPGGQLGRVEGNQVKAVVSGLPPVFDMTVVQRNIVLVGQATSAAAAGAPLAAAVITIDRSDRGRAAFPTTGQLPSLTRRFELPSIQVRLSNEVSPEGYLAWVSPPREATVYHLEVSPDGQRAVLLLSATYGSQMQLASCIYRSQITGTSYLLVDLDAGKVLLSRFTQLSFSDCRTNCATYQGQPMSDRAVCAAGLEAVLHDRGELVRPGFDARAATLLFGY